MAAKRPASLLNDPDTLFAGVSRMQRLLVAVSGGADSVALLHLLTRWPSAPPLVAATVDHGLRPDSAIEARSVAEQVRALGVAHHILTWDGALPPGGVEEGARAARYALLEDCARKAGADCLITAHTLDDQAETVLMRLAAGSGPAGLAAMRPLTMRAPGLAHARPLLGVAKAELVAYLRAAGIGWVEDPMNRDDAFTRVRLRDAARVLAREGLTPARLGALARRMARLDEAVTLQAEAVRAKHVLAAEGRLLIDASVFGGLADEVALRVLRCMLVEIAPESEVRLERLESLLDAVLAACRSGADLPGRTLGGVRFSVSGGRVRAVAAAPRRASGVDKGGN